MFKSQAIILSTVLLLCTGLAAQQRIAQLDIVQVYSDSLSPYLAACRAWHTGWSAPPNPEADHWMWLTALPQLLLASSLHDLFTIRSLISALTAPLTVLCIWVSLPASWSRTVLSLTGGVVIAMDSGLLDTHISSFRGYMAPEWIGLASLCWLLRARSHWWRWAALLCVAIAGGHHPLALGCVLCVLGMIERKNWPMLLVVLLLGYGFRMLWIAELLQCDAGGLACLMTVAQGSAEQMSSIDIVQRALHTRFWTELSWGGPLLALGWLLAPKAERRWLALALTGLLLLGLGISTLRPYHLRILAVPLTAWAMIGFAQRRWWWLGLLALTTILQRPTLGGTEGHIQTHDQLGLSLLNQQGPFWLEGTSTGELQHSASGAVLSAWLQGLPAEQLPATPVNVLMLLEDGSIKPLGAAESAMQWQQSTGVELLGGLDWATAFHPAASVTTPW